jgi:transcription elongation factor GreA
MRTTANADTPSASGSHGEARPDEVVLTPEGYRRLEEELGRLVTATRPEAEARLAQALQVPGDLADNPDYLDAQADLERIEGRIERLERRLRAARVLRAGERSSRVASLGSHVVLEDLDDGAREEYVLVSSVESNPSEGRLSNESPVGRAVAGRRRGDVVDAVAPHRVRHLRIVDLRVEREAGPSARREPRRSGSRGRPAGRRGGSGSAAGPAT